MQVSASVRVDDPTIIIFPSLPPSLQVTPQQVADRSNKLVVEYKNECLMRPVVVAVPKTMTESEVALLKSLQMVQVAGSSQV